MMKEGNNFVWFIRGGTNMCPANVNGYDEAHISYYNRDPLRPVGTPAFLLEFIEEMPGMGGGAD